jgi:alpha-glucosidase
VGAFYPFFRNHNADWPVDHEPWRFGERIEALCREAIALRYHLLPFFYQLFYAMHTTGAPMVRPLFWHYPRDRATYPPADQFMLGEELVVAPVVERGACCRCVYLPEGTWYDFSGQKEYAGGRNHLVDVDLASIPLFVRQSAVLPVMDPVDSTARFDRTKLTLKIYPGTGERQQVYYEDDLHSNAYRTGDFALNSIRRTADSVTVELAPESNIDTVTLQHPAESTTWSSTAYKKTKKITHPLAP